MTHTRRIAISGGGPVGLAAACLAAQEGFDTTILAPDHARDMRTVALMQPAIRLLRHVGVWNDALVDKSQALQRLHIIDDTGHYITAPKLEFSAEEMGETAFGWNVPLTDLIAALWQRALELGCRMVPERATSIEIGPEQIALKAESGEVIVAPVAIAADGRNSLLRHAVGISVSTHNWDQKALIASFAHSQPHHGISAEFHRPNGLFTYVPQPGQRASLVWMDRPETIDALAELNGALLASEIQVATHGQLGLISDVGPSQRFAMTTSQAARFAAKRVFLVGEAAHAMPPIGAQGLNMSLRDVGHAIDVIVNAENPGDARSCETYHNLRIDDVMMRSGAISFMNYSLLSDSHILAGLRAAGLTMVHAVPMVRRIVMEQGLAPHGLLPFAMRI